MPRADEPRVMVRLSAELHGKLEAWAVEHEVKVPAILREAAELVGERAAGVAAAKRAARLEASGRSRKMPRAAPSRSRPDGAAKTSAPPPAAPIHSERTEAMSPAAVAVDRADAFRQMEERKLARRRALRS